MSLSEIDDVPRLMTEAEPETEMPSQDQPAEHRLVPLLTWLGVILTILMIPLRIISYGYLPPDDGLRHAAKAVSGRDWSDVIVMQDQFKMDHNPGWHWILGVVHRITGANVESLVLIGLCGLALLVMLAPLGWMRRPEAWVASLLVSTVIFPQFFYRILIARPLAFSMAVSLVILLLWRRPLKGRPPVWLVAASTVLFALAAWIHGSWYLLALVVASFALAAQWRTALWVGGCWLGGSFLGGLLTGHPISFLWNEINIAINCFTNNQVQRVLVDEFKPSDGAFPTVLLTGLLLVIRGVSGRWTWKSVNNPVFMLMVLGWVLGLRVIRFWVDWSLPALVLWIALEFHEQFERLLTFNSFRRLGITAGLCAALFFATTSDLKSRWTENLMTEYLSKDNPEMAEWLPDDGGIIYSAYMQVFYDTFFKNPNAKWKYMLGFESTFMPPEDLRILRNIQWNFYAPKGYEPWVAKMRPQDRMVILGPSPTPPPISELEWKNVARQTWVGRLPRKTEAPKETSKIAAGK